MCDYPCSDSKKLSYATDGINAVKTVVAGVGASALSLTSAEETTLAIQYGTSQSCWILPAALIASLEVVDSVASAFAGNHHQSECPYLYFFLKVDLLLRA